MLSSINSSSENPIKNIISTSTNSLYLAVNNTERQNKSEYSEDNLNMGNNDVQNIILNEIRNLRSDIADLKAENKIINNNIENIKSETKTQIEKISSENQAKFEIIKNENKNARNLIMVLFTVITIVVSIFFAVIKIGIDGINKNIDSVQQNNSMQIQRDVAQEFLNHKR